MNETSETGRTAANLIEAGIEVNAEIALEEPQCTQGVDEELLSLVQKYGLKELLASIQCAAWGAAECHEEMEDMEVASLRLRVFGTRLGEAIAALK